MPSAIGGETVNYRESLTQAMTAFSADPLSRFVGYGLLNGKGGNGTMKAIPNEKIVETTVAENLLIGIAHGLSLTGLRCLALIERADFLPNCLSAISHHLDCANLISRGQFNPCVIIRVVIGNSQKPLFTGHTHTRNLAPAMKALLRMPVYEVTTPDEVQAAYYRAMREQREGIGSSMIFERKDLL